MVFNPFPDAFAILWDLIAAVISFFILLLLVQINGRIQRSGKLSTIITRKIVHIFAGPIYMVTWLLFSGFFFSRFIALIVPLIFTLQFYLIGTGRTTDEEFVRSMSRSGDPSELLKGTFYYTIVMILISILWFYIPLSRNINNANPASLVIIGCLSGGDGLADIFGRKYGGEKKFGIGESEKTLIGTIAMFVGSFLLSFILLLIFTFEVPSFNPLFLIIPLLIISFAATVAEILSPKNTDNIFIPILVVITIILLSIFLPTLWPFDILSF